jgi:hypothetical protein
MVPDDKESISEKERKNEKMGEAEKREEKQEKYLKLLIKLSI